MLKIINREHRPGWCSKKVIPLKLWKPRLKRYTTTASSNPALPLAAKSTLRGPQGQLVSHHQMLEVSRFGELKKGLPKKKADKLELSRN